jgi:hypothetical protein
MRKYCKLTKNMLDKCGIFYKSRGLRDTPPNIYKFTRKEKYRPNAFSYVKNQNFKLIKDKFKYHSVFWLKFINYYNKIEKNLYFISG